MKGDNEGDNGKKNAATRLLNDNIHDAFIKPSAALVNLRPNLHPAEHLLCLRNRGFQSRISRVDLDNRLFPINVNFSAHDL